jgi:hypothetical protein
MADGFTSPPKEGVLPIFITLKNPSTLAGIELTSLGSNGKHASHYITDSQLHRSVFLKLSAIADYFIGGRRPCGPPS